MLRMPLINDVVDDDDGGRGGQEIFEWIWNNFHAVEYSALTLQARH